MSNKEKILFRFGNTIQPLTRFGELVLLYRACYYKGKELGYDDRNTFFEWPLNIEYTRNHYLKKHEKHLEGELKCLECPKETILPIQFIRQENVIQSEYSKILNLIDKDIFYKDSPPLYNPQEKEKRSHISFLNYLNKYYIDFKERPVFDIDKDEIKEKYILIHTRNALNSPTRNPNISSYRFIIKLLRKRYNKYKLYRCGELSDNRDFNRLFDEYFEPMTDFNNFLRLMNNSSLFVGCGSGPINYAYSFGIPIIELDVPSSLDWGYDSKRYEGMGNFYSKDIWKRGFNGKYGDTTDYHIDSNTYLKLFKEDKMNSEVICDFIDRWLDD